jgi:hypothetical protein
VAGSGGKVVERGVMGGDPVLLVLDVDGVRGRSAVFPRDRVLFPWIKAFNKTPGRGPSVTACGPKFDEPRPTSFAKFVECAVDEKIDGFSEVKESPGKLSIM